MPEPINLNVNVNVNTNEHEDDVSQLDEIQCRIECVERKLDRLLLLVEAVLSREGKILEREKSIMSALSDLAAEVADEKTVLAGFIVAWDGLVEKLKALPNQDPALVALTADIKAQKQAMADALVRGTAAESEPA